jgi:glycosyltransferase involved in cell wall biosynthesis
MLLQRDLVRQTTNCDEGRAAIHPLKILMLAPGMSVHTQRIIAMLLEAGHSVTLVAQQDPLPEGVAHYEFIRFPGIRGIHRIKYSWVASLERLIRIAQMRMIWRRTRPDVVNVQGVDLRAFYCASAGLRPLVLTCWGTDINCLFGLKTDDPSYRTRLIEIMSAKGTIPADIAPLMHKHRKRIAKALAAADSITVDSPLVSSRCEALVGRKLPIRLFYFGVDFGRFRPGYAQEAAALRRKLGIPATAKVILSARLIQPLNGHDHLLRAFATLTRDPRLPASALVLKRYLCCQEEVARLATLVEELGVSSSVHWLDEVPYDHMPAQYAMADVIVNYPEQDAFPVTFFEAAACKRPVITSNLPAYENVFGDSFLTIPPKDVPALCHALRQCLTEDDSQTRKRVEKAYAIACEVGDRRQSIKVLNAAFEEVTTRRLH